jgi:hypothetical protein
MRKFIYLSIIVTFFLFPGGPLYGQMESTYKTLSNGFKNPPSSAQPIVYHWWLGGNVDTVRLKEEIVSLKNAGISGFTMFEIGSRDTVLVKAGPEFLGKESLETIKFAVEEAGKLGMEVGLNTASSWNAGGKWITPEHAAKSIYYSQIELSGKSRQRNKLPFPKIPEKDPWGKPRLIEYAKNGKPVFYEEIAVLAIPANIGNGKLDTTKIVNVSQYYDPKNETLNWKAPEGSWEVYRYVCANSGENLILPSRHSAGPIVDHYDAAATEFHFMYIINRLKSVLGDLRNTALKSLYMASYEAKGFTWTTTLPAVFKEINGYEIDKFLPALFYAELFPPNLQANFRADYQRTLSELMINNFYKKSREICNAHGLKNNCEAGGPGLPLHNVPVEPIKALGSLDIPRGEFWINHFRMNEQGIDILRVVKEVSAASHIYNRGIVEMEAFTSFQHWQEGPFEMKPWGDRAFCEGMNKVVVHGSTHNPPGTGFPGIVYHAGTHYNDKRVWWPKVRPFNEYMARISYIFQEADFVADVLYYYGDTIPNYGGHKNSRFTVGPGYDYEIVNTEILLEATVKDNKLVLPRNNAQFSMLVIAEEYEINPKVLLKLDELANKGAVIVGPKPEKVISRWDRNDPDVVSLTNKLWVNDRNFSGEKGKIYGNVQPLQVLESLNIVPDFNYPGKELNTLDFIHYAKGDMDFYFVRNTTGEWITKTCSFRQKNKTPEFWDPVSGEIVAAPVFNQQKDHINVPIGLAPYGSIFVVFRQGNQSPQFSRVNYHQNPPFMSYSKDGVLIWEEGKFELESQNKKEVIHNFINNKNIEGAWEVFFPEGWGAPERVIFPELVSWTKSDNDGIKYFSGIATYRKSFVHDIIANKLEGAKIYLDLGDLSHVGEVWLNDQSLGIAWAKPYRFDISDILRPGNNTLVIEVANTWSNRIVGDAVKDEKYTSTNITNTIVHGMPHVRLGWKDVPLIESGLFGPVTIKTMIPVRAPQVIGL